MREALPIEFQLQQAAETRFRVLVVKDANAPAGNLYDWASERGIEVFETADVGDLKGDHFWIALSTKTRTARNLSPAIHRNLSESVQAHMAARGYRIGETLAADPVELFPVWRRE
jgi:hypothetical protein